MKWQREIQGDIHRQRERKRGGEALHNNKEIEWEGGKEEKRVRQTDKQEDNKPSETNREL